MFNSETSQNKVFDEVDGLVQSALDGYKVCVFAYGQTGSGKTFTMQGARETEQWGIIPRALCKILQEAEKMRVQGWQWTLEASFIEVPSNEVMK